MHGKIANKKNSKTGKHPAKGINRRYKKLKMNSGSGCEKQKRTFRNEHSRLKIQGDSDSNKQIDTGGPECPPVLFQATF